MLGPPFPYLLKINDKCLPLHNRVRQFKKENLYSDLICSLNFAGVIMSSVVMTVEF